MKFNNVYFFNGTAYAGKSTMVKRLAEKYDGIACEENYHESLMGGLDWNEFPNLGYTANLKDWADFIRRTPDEYARWIEVVTTFKGTYITGWQGYYHLEGSNELINFLYYAGLGDRNSQGFGMFKII